MTRRSHTFHLIRFNSNVLINFYRKIYNLKSQFSEKTFYNYISCNLCKEKKMWVIFPTARFTEKFTLHIISICAPRYVLIFVYYLIGGKERVSGKQLADRQERTRNSIAPSFVGLFTRIKERSYQNVNYIFKRMRNRYVTARSSDRKVWRTLVRDVIRRG